MKNNLSTEPALLPFGHFFLRTPLLPFRKNNPISEKDPIFNEIIYIASPEFYKEKVKYDNQIICDKKMKESIYKYYTRASTRCTPFGLFAGCSIGKISTGNNIVLADIPAYKRYTRLDMDYMCALIRYVESIPEIRNQLIWHPNNSIYKLGEKIRYAEYIYYGLRRSHRLCGVDYSDELKKILTLANHGATIHQLTTLLVNENITWDEAQSFVYEVIEAQLLKSELEIGITGENPINTFLNKLHKLEGIPDLKNAIQQIQELLIKIDLSPIGTSVHLYERIVEIVQRLKIPFKIQHLFQTDLFKPIVKAEIDTQITCDIYKCIEFLNSLTPISSENNLSHFKKKFYERYENEEIPLLLALDKESGLGYPPNKDNGDINELTDNIILPKIGQQKPEYTINGLEMVLWQKITEVLTAGQTTLDLSAINYSVQKPYWEDIPNTLSVLCNILIDKTGNQKVYLKSVGGNNGAFLIGRFGHLNQEIQKHLQEITQKEQEMSPDSILAEIVHLPEARTGNILCRPLLRKYEIPYLAQAGVNQEFQLSPSELTIAIRNNRIILYSSKLKKEIIPCLTNAHHYSRNPIPVYHFLCDLQNQQKRTNFFLSMGYIFNVFDHLPRIEYGNCILSRQKWKIKADEIKKAYEEKNITEWRKKRQLPECIVFPEGDNELFIDFRQDIGIQTLISILKKQKQITVEEFLFEEYKSVVKNKDEEFCNEFIISFYKKQQK